MDNNEGIPIPGEVEQKARVMGWVPKEEFRGDEEKWVDAERFVSRGENELPIMRERIDKLTTGTVKLQNTIKEMRNTFSEFQKFQLEAQKKSYDKAYKDIIAKQRDAVLEGDTVSFERLENEKTALQTELTETIKKPDPAEEEFNEWLEGNEWFKNDPELGNYAVHIADFLQAQKGLKGAALYNAAKEEVEIRFPEKMGKKAKAEPRSMVESGNVPPAQTGKRTYANLPEEAKRACDRFVKEIPGYTKERYINEYEWE